MADANDNHVLASTSGSTQWPITIARIREAQTRLMRLAPFRDASLIANPAASSEAIARAERRVGRPLPASYRAFLKRHDGWPRFFHGAALLGTRDLGKSSYADLAQAAFEAAVTPVPEGGPPSSRVRGYPTAVIPFGIDAHATTLFAFDPSHETGDGELEVVAWINEIGIRSRNFSEFMVCVAELCEADLESLQAAEQLAKSA